MAILPLKVRVLLVGYAVLASLVSAWLLVEVWKDFSVNLGFYLVLIALLFLIASALANIGVVLRGWRIRLLGKLELLLFAGIFIIAVTCALLTRWPSLSAWSPAIMDAFLIECTLLASAAYIKIAINKFYPSL